jgi:hypothetical protein
MFVPGKSLQLCPMLVGKTMSLTKNGAPEKVLGSGRFGLHANFGLGCKGLPGTSTLAYYEYYKS